MIGRHMRTPPLQLDEVPERLRAMRADAGEPSYAEIARRIAAHRAADAHEPVSRATVYDCFRDGRKRFDSGLVLAIVRALARDEASVRAWASALAAIGQRRAAAGVVTVTDALPAPLAPFVGRSLELSRLTRMPAAHWLTAMPGSGKTALAVHAAHAAIASGAVADAIVVDLRGHSALGPPAEPEAVVRAVLRLLGEKRGGLPAATARRTLRHQLREQGRLLLLDDAASPEQVHRIVPNPSGVAVLVTSRSVPAPDGFLSMDVPLFAPYESLALLDELAGRAVIERDPESAQALLERTAHLPLAVSLTAGRVAAMPGWTLAEHLELADSRRSSLRLDAPVHHSLDLTYRHLSDPAQRLLRAIADHPVGLLDSESIAVIAGTPAAETQAALTELEQRSVLTIRATGAVHMHELVRVFAVDRGREVDPASLRRAAAERLRRSLIDRAWSAHLARSQARRAVGRTPRAPLHAMPRSAAAAEAFFAETSELLLHIALRTEEAVTTDTGPATINLIAEAFDDALHRAGRSDDAEQLFREALRIARDRGDVAGEQRALVDLGATLTLRGNVDEAESVFAAVDRDGEGWASEAPLVHNARGTCLLAQGRIDDARTELDAGLEAAAAQGDLWRESLLWNGMALLQLRTGDLAGCRLSLERSITMSEHCGDVTATARGRINLSNVLLELGDNTAAAAEAQAGLTAMEELGHVPGTVVAAANLAAAMCGLQRFDESAVLAERGIDAARRAGMQQTELELLRTLSDARFGSGQEPAARDALHEALRIAESLGDRVSADAVRDDLVR